MVLIRAGILAGFTVLFHYDVGFYNIVYHIEHNTSSIKTSEFQYTRYLLQVNIMSSFSGYNLKVTVGVFYWSGVEYEHMWGL